MEKLSFSFIISASAFLLAQLTCLYPLCRETQSWQNPSNNTPAKPNRLDCPVNSTSAEEKATLSLARPAEARGRRGAGSERPQLQRAAPQSALPSFNLARLPLNGDGGSPSHDAAGPERTRTIKRGGLLKTQPLLNHFSNCLSKIEL